MTGPPPVLARLNLHNQASLLHPSGLSQLAVLLLFRHWGVGESCNKSQLEVESSDGVIGKSSKEVTATCDGSSIIKSTHNSGDGCDTGPHRKEENPIRHGLGWYKHLKKLRAFYQQQSQVFVSAAMRHLCCSETGKPLARFHVPTAGMFVWMELLGVEDAAALISTKAREAKVLLVPGVVFSPSGSKSGWVRAAYSTATPEQIDEAMQRLALLLLEHTSERRNKALE